ncbi:MAG: SRPBCC family protein [Methanobacterium sp.]|jgi:hypothetical protein
MKQKIQWEVKVSINAPVEQVWDVTQDLSLIPVYHPEVEKIEFLSDQTNRAEGVEYKCIIPEGKPRSGSCVEKVVENDKYKKTTTLAVEDTWGLSEMLKNYTTDLIFEKIDDTTTTLHFQGYYEPIGFKNKILNILILRRVMKKRGKVVLIGIKDLIEKKLD